jgi:hypothetical protein
MSSALASHPPLLRLPASDAVTPTRGFLRARQPAFMFGKCYKGRVMPMLHGCAFPGCETLTLSPYCLEHELFVRAEIEAERGQAPYEATDREVVAVPRGAA